jgi:hypothetical protein
MRINIKAVKIMILVIIIVLIIGYASAYIFTRDYLPDMKVRISEERGNTSKLFLMLSLSSPMERLFLQRATFIQQTVIQRNAKAQSVAQRERIILEGLLSDKTTGDDVNIDGLVDVIQTGNEVLYRNKDFIERKLLFRKMDRLLKEFKENNFPELQRVYQPKAELWKKSLEHLYKGGKNI